MYRLFLTVFNTLTYAAIYGDKTGSKLPWLGIIV